MKRTLITTASATAMGIGLVLAYGLRWLYVSVLERNPAYTVFIGIAVAIAMILAMSGALAGIAIGLWDMKQGRDKR